MDKRLLSVAPVKRRKLYEDISDSLEKMMLSGALKPGDLLPSERELMETFRVGRTSVREALFSLQKMGLVSLKSGERGHVTRPTASTLVNGLSGAVRHLLARPEGVSEMQQVRALLEVSLSRFAAEHATEKDLKELKRALLANQAAIGHLEEFVRTDVEFHLVLATIPRNSVLTSLHLALADWLSEQRRISLRGAKADKLAYKAHETIFNAIVRRDVAGAEEAMYKHLSAVEKLYWRHSERKRGMKR